MTKKMDCSVKQNSTNRARMARTRIERTTMEKLRKQTTNTNSVWDSVRILNGTELDSGLGRCRPSNGTLFTGKRIFWFTVLTIAFQLFVAASASVHSSALSNYHGHSSSKNHTKSACYQTILHQCGRQFIEGYKLLSKGVNISPDDFFTTQCTLRSSFFNCITEKTRDCKKLHGEDWNTKFEDELLAYKDAKSKSGIDPKLPERVDRYVARAARRQRRNANFQRRLSNTIWKSRVCIFRSSIHAPGSQ